MGMLGGAPAGVGRKKVYTFRDSPTEDETKKVRKIAEDMTVKGRNRMVAKCRGETR